MIGNKLNEWRLRKRKDQKKDLESKLSDTFRKSLPPISDVTIHKEEPAATCPCGNERKQTKLPDYDFLTVLYCPKCRAGGMLISEDRLNVFLETIAPKDRAGWLKSFLSKLSLSGKNKD